MENFSTPRTALVPRATNLATLAVVAAAMWWSGAQRPVDPSPMASARSAAEASPTAALPLQQSTGLTAPSSVAAAPVSMPNAANTAPVQANGFWAAQTAANIARDGLQAVGFKTGSQR